MTNVGVGRMKLGSSLNCAETQVCRRCGPQLLFFIDEKRKEIKVVVKPHVEK